MKEDNQEIVITSNPEKMEAFAKEMRNEMRGQFEEKTKFSIAEGMQDVEKKDFFTEFKDFNDVLRMNTNEMWVKLIPIIFKKKTREYKPNINEIVEVFAYHCRQHKLNMTSLNRAREKAIVDILRMDNGYVQQDRAQKTFVGINTK